MINNLYKKLFGFIGESDTEYFLTKQGFKVLCKNFKSRYGEIDLIATKAELIVFVEVKTRSNEYFALSSVIVPSKQKKIIATAKYFLINNPKYLEMVCRFDVAIVLKKNDKNSINYIEDAFREF